MMIGLCYEYVKIRKGCVYAFQRNDYVLLLLLLLTLHYMNARVVWLNRSTIISVL